MSQMHHERKRTTQVGRDLFRVGERTPNPKVGRKLFLLGSFRY